VLIGPGEEEGVITALAVVAGEDVGGDRLIRMAQVRLAVDVRDRGGDVEGDERQS
jgi:hypothetical protein